MAAKKTSKKKTSKKAPAKKATTAKKAAQKKPAAKRSVRTRSGKPQGKQPGAPSATPYIVGASLVPVGVSIARYTFCACARKAICRSLL